MWSNLNFLCVQASLYLCEPPFLALNLPNELCLSIRILNEVKQGHWTRFNNSRPGVSQPKKSTLSQHTQTSKQDSQSGYPFAKDFKFMVRFSFQVHLHAQDLNLVILWFLSQILNLIHLIPRLDDRS